MSKPITLPKYLDDKTEKVQLKILRAIVARQHQQLRYWILEKDKNSKGIKEFEKLMEDVRKVVKESAYEYSDSTPMEEVKKVLIRMALRKGNDRAKVEKHVNRLLEVAARDINKRRELILSLN